MRKLIDIPDEIVKDLKRLALEADTNLKAYIENLVIEHHAKQSKKLKK
jgi:hypothetical protein